MKKAELEAILNTTICKKGCGEVKIEVYYGNPICSKCGEELDFQLPSAQIKYLKKYGKKAEVD